LWSLRQCATSIFNATIASPRARFTPSQDGAGQAETFEAGEAETLDGQRHETDREREPNRRRLGEHARGPEQERDRRRRGCEQDPELPSEDGNEFGATEPSALLDAR
jgi:hypothetical protein